MGGHSEDRSGPPRREVILKTDQGLQLRLQDERSFGRQIRASVVRDPSGDRL